MSEGTGIVLRTLAVTSALLLAAILLGQRRRSPAAVPGAMLALAIAAFFATSFSGSHQVYGIWKYPLTAICVTKAIWFWLSSRSLFRDGAGVTLTNLIPVGLIAVLGTWQQVAFMPAYRAGQTTTVESIAGLGFEVVLLVFVLAGLYEAWRDLATDLVEKRRHLRVRFIALTGTYLLGTLFVQGFNQSMGTSTPVLATWANMVFAAVACLAATALLLQPRSNSWIDRPPARSVVSLSPLEATILAQLERALAGERIHLRNSLTIGALADYLGTSEQVLRRVINQGMGHRNFNDFLHKWRIQEACDELSRANQRKEPILSIAMKVGYGSIGAFNRAFKQQVGMTPTAFRRRSASRTY